MAQRGARGFTLLEMMLVIVLLASVSMMVMGALPSRGTDIRRESSRLLNILHWAQEQSMLDGDIYGLSVASDGWQLLKLCHTNCEDPIASADNVWPGAVWLAARQKSTLLRRSLSDVVLLLSVEQNNQLLKAQEDNVIAPQLLFYPGGESSQFDLRLMDAEKPQRQSALVSEGIGWVHFRNDDDEQ
jgi:general secretion pathway protein H